MDGVMNMNKFDKMVECNRRISIEKIDLARKTILDMVEEGERVTVQRLMAQTGLSRGFFTRIQQYENWLMRLPRDRLV